ncbi:SalE [Streptomyces albus]|uniref:Trehalose 6-phosphate phosphatase n=1 Tax=Streptomyces albus (strain ATCC 21838 / DSM 41398 / FERM P-419 / JCM 4703 / NBRC 107858) TaxID=1081613 RepID=A3FKK5_STRA4|nr:SalE [Streptomyces albus]AJE80959.1 SalE [Streptomyces albus]AOU75271.1 SalE [Streptomyces albus]AYN31076.1 salbostatin 6'-phosphate phosphatase [Streptomyces albus]
MRHTAEGAGRPADRLRAPDRAVLAPFPAVDTLICADLDGTLVPPSPPTPDMARHTADLRELCGRLPAHPRLALVCVTGRRALNAREILASPLWVAGVHGAESLAPYAYEALPHPRSVPHLPAVRRVARLIRELALCPPEMHIEDKEVVLAVHHARLPAERAASRLSRLASLGRASGMEVVAGRGWTEIRPPGSPHKGDAVVEMVRRWRPRRLVVAGDDHGDLAMFEAADRLVEEGSIDRATCVAVRGPGADPECLRRAQVVLEGPDACRTWFRGLARSLATGGGARVDVPARH